MTSWKTKKKKCLCDVEPKTQPKCVIEKPKKRRKRPEDLIFPDLELKYKKAQGEIITFTSKLPNLNPRT